MQKNLRFKEDVGISEKTGDRIDFPARKKSKGKLFSGRIGWRSKKQRHLAERAGEKVETDRQKCKKNCN